MFTKFHEDLIWRFKITPYMGRNTVVLDGQAFSYVGLRSIRQEIPQKTTRYFRNGYRYINQ